MNIQFIANYDILLGQFQVFENEWFSYIIFFGTALLCGLAGFFVARFAYITQVKKYGIENDQFRELQLEAQQISIELQEKQRRLELDLTGKIEELSLVNDQLKATKHALEQSKNGWRASQIEIQDREAIITDMRAETESLRLQIADQDRVAINRKHELQMIGNQLAEANLRNQELQRIATERQSQLAEANNAIMQLRTRITQINHHNAELSGILESFKAHLDLIKRNVQDFDFDDRMSDVIDSTFVARPQQNGNGAKSAPHASVDTSIGAMETLLERGTSPYHVHTDEKPESAYSDLSEGNNIGAMPYNTDNLALNEPARRHLAESPTSAEVGEDDDTDNASELPKQSSPTPVKPSEPSTNGVRGDSDIRLVKGIEPQYIKKLKEKGIRTVRDLANANATYLHSVLPSPAWRLPRCTEWIEEARKIMGRA